MCKNQINVGISHRTGQMLRNYTQSASEKSRCYFYSFEEFPWIWTFYSRTLTFNRQSLQNTIVLCKAIIIYFITTVLCSCDLYISNLFLTISRCIGTCLILGYWMQHCPATWNSAKECLVKLCLPQRIFSFHFFCTLVGSLSAKIFLHDCFFNGSKLKGQS